MNKQFERLSCGILPIGNVPQLFYNQSGNDWQAKRKGERRARLGMEKRQRPPL
ncbi:MULTISPECIES: hypothetical protein [unclassified Paenibacillus]|uniref:hypothetical protein n=1 Tax=unclassified Paenibacillus TaxID=185978 RepID=UPI002F41E328